MSSPSSCASGVEVDGITVGTQAPRECNLMSRRDNPMGGEVKSALGNNILHVCLVFPAFVTLPV